MLLIFMRNWAPLLWLLLAVILGIFEAVTVDLVAIWFAAGAFVAVIPALLGAPGWVQFLVFLAVSLVTLAFTRPAVSHLLHVRKTSTNADRVIGMMGIVSEPIHNVTDEGRVQVNGLSWAARSDDGEPIEKGESVLVKEIDGVKLIVERI
jgi:membrane protein implicated in regulation of membrane protease activity